MIYIFDLDGTLIDSSHRQLTRTDGSLDLANWIHNCTRRKILADSLLPLADYARDLISKGNLVIACTARVMGTSDFEFLTMHGLHFDRILSRPHGCTDSDVTLKRNLFEQDAKACGMTLMEYANDAMFFDDNAGILNMADEIGMVAFNSVTLNKAAA